MKQLARLALSLLAFVFASNAFASNDVVYINGLPLFVSTINSGSVQAVAVYNSATVPLSMQAAPVNSTPTSVSVGTTSAQAVASATRTYLSIDNPGAATIACSFGGTAILNTPPSYSIPAASGRIWGPGTAPSGAINCIASASTTVTIASY